MMRIGLDGYGCASAGERKSDASSARSGLIRVSFGKVSGEL
jgi:hypothetical protein